MRLAAPFQRPAECVQVGGERLHVHVRFKAATDEDQPAGRQKGHHLRILAQPTARLRHRHGARFRVTIAGGGDILEGEVRLSHLEFIVACRERLPRPGAARQPELVAALGQRLVLEEIGHKVAGRRIEPGARHARAACDLERAVGGPRRLECRDAHGAHALPLAPRLAVDVFGGSLRGSKFLHAPGGGDGQIRRPVERVRRRVALRERHRQHERVVVLTGERGPRAHLLPRWPALHVATTSREVADVEVMVEREVGALGQAHADLRTDHKVVEDATAAAAGDGHADRRVVCEREVRRHAALGLDESQPGAVRRQDAVLDPRGRRLLHKHAALAAADHHAGDGGILPADDRHAILAGILDREVTHARPRGEHDAVLLALCIEHGLPAARALERYPRGHSQVAGLERAGRDGDGSAGLCLFQSQEDCRRQWCSGERPAIESDREEAGEKERGGALAHGKETHRCGFLRRRRAEEVAGRQHNRGDDSSMTLEPAWFHNWRIRQVQVFS